MKPALILAALLMSPPAFAQTGPDPARQSPASTIVAEPVALTIAGFDADGDARVDRAEFDAGLRRSFDSIAGGAESIGYIGFSDWALRFLGDRNALPSPFEVDHDGDNRITYAELAARFDLLFERFDTDKDGTITRAELLTLRGFAIGDRTGKQQRMPEDGQKRRRNLLPMR